MKKKGQQPHTGCYPFFIYSAFSDQVETISLNGDLGNVALEGLKDWRQ
jgi:hypothetical protein